MNSAAANSPFALEVAPLTSDEFSSHRLNRLEHNAHEHELLQIDALRVLARKLLPRGQCRFVDPAIEIDSAFKHSSELSHRASIDELFDRLDEPRSWIALYNIETDATYQALLQQLIAPVRPLVEAEQGEILDVGGFIFISTPPSVTPFHIDRENNFWLQLHGRKIMTVFDHSDREIVSAEAVDEFIVARSLDTVRLRDEIADRGTEMDMQPGQGVYFPSTSPHMTRCPESFAENGVSVSIGVVFYTEHTRKIARVHQCNRLLRRLGIQPSYPGQQPWRDQLKAPLGWAFANARRYLRGYRPPPGAC